MRQLKINKSYTNRDSLDVYLKDIASIDLIDTDREVYLAGQIKKGNKQALNELVCANLRFVVSVAKQYQNRGLGLADLVNEGNIGLLHAAEKFDETKGFKFISYAVWWIRQSILQALAEQSRNIRIPINQVGVISKINKVYSRYEQLYQRFPSPEEVSKEIDIPADKIEELLKASVRNVSIDAPVSEDSSPLVDLIPDKNSPIADNNLAKEDVSIEVERVLNTLTVRERAIIRLTFGIGCQELSIESIGDRLDLSRERVRQLKEQALAKLRKKYKILKNVL